MGLAVITFASIVAMFPAQNERSTFGVAIDAGVPDGVQAAVMFRPWSFLRAHAGGGYNLVSPGIRGGLTLIPLDTIFRPTFSFEAGRYFTGNLHNVDKLIALGEMRETRVGYDWASAHLGLEVDWGGGAFFIQGGVTRIFASVGIPDFDEMMQARVYAPTAKLGFIVWL